MKQALRCVILSGRPGEEIEIIALRLLTGDIRVQTADLREEIIDVKRYICDSIRIEVMP